jgi:hypothetical protein
MTYAEAVKLFGIEDRLPSEILLRLYVFCQRFGPNELLGVFRMLAEEFRGKNDVSSGARCHLTSANLALMIANKTYFSSDVISRNLYRIMFLSSEWDSEILFQPDFIEDFCHFVSEQEPRREGYGPGSAPFNRALDLYEMLLEFKDKLVDKVKMASGA